MKKFVQFLFAFLFVVLAAGVFPLRVQANVEEKVKTRRAQFAQQIQDRFSRSEVGMLVLEMGGPDEEIAGNFAMPIVAENLINWAVRANRLADLLTRIALQRSQVFKAEHWIDLLAMRDQLLELASIPRSEEKFVLSGRERALALEMSNRFVPWELDILLLGKWRINLEAITGNHGTIKTCEDVVTWAIQKDRLGALIDAIAKERPRLFRAKDWEDLLVARKDCKVPLL